jgi:hypothetical protein
MAEAKGVVLRRLLLSADFFNELAIREGFFHVKTFFSKSSALLRFVTSADQRFRKKALQDFFINISFLLNFFYY